MAERSLANHNRRMLYEISVVMLLTVGLIILLPSLRTIIYFLPVVYLLVEHRLRHRPWSEAGFKHGFIKDLAKNWHLFIIVAVILQIAVPVLLKFFWPELLNQIFGRLGKLPGGEAIAGTVVLIIIGSLVEEVTFRGLFQERIGWFLSQFAAILLVSLLFALSHITVADPLLVGADITLVFIDSCFYGLIFSRSRNVMVSWFTHMMADIIGFAMLLVILSL
jgi:membrane protease YdiL (CAAX protease family)